MGIDDVRPIEKWGLLYNDQIKLENNQKQQEKSFDEIFSLQNIEEIPEKNIVSLENLNFDHSESSIISDSTKKSSTNSLETHNSIRIF